MGLAQKLTELDIALEDKCPAWDSILDGSNFMLSKNGQHFLCKKNWKKVG